MMSIRIGFALLAIIAVVAATPLERKRRMTRPDSKGPTVVDIPAGVFDTDGDSLSSDPVQKLHKVPLELQEPEIEFLPPSLKTGQDSAESVEDDVLTPSKDSEQGTNVFGFRVPTVFVIRRPVFRDPFASFTPFQSFRPFSGFGERRPVVTDASSTDKEDRFDTMNHMEGMLKRMQQQMSSLWGSFLTPTYQRPFRPIFPSFESSEVDSSNETSVLNIDNLPANYSNSTSETKVVNGHVVEVNKTIHKISSGNNNSGFFSFQVINVRPTTGPSTSVTPESAEHIIPAEVEVKPESTHTVQVEQSSTTTSTTPKPEDPTQNEVGADDKDTFPYLVGESDQVQTMDESPEYEFIPQQREIDIKPRSLSGDLRVNKLMEQQRLRAPYLRINPDVEYVDV